jgi:hypothetical protein
MRFSPMMNGGILVYAAVRARRTRTAITVDINRRIRSRLYLLTNPDVPSGAKRPRPYDVFLTHVDVTGSPLAFSSFLGGTGADQAYGVAINSAGEMFLTGATSSSNFPTQSAYRYTTAGSLDMFLAALSAAPVPPSAPVFLSLAPNAGSGPSPQFTIKYTDANGANNFESIQVLVNSIFAGANSCQVAYVHATGLVYLLNNAATAWLGGYPPGALNGCRTACSLPPDKIVTATGNDLTLYSDLFATTTFTGTKIVYGLALDKGGLRSDWAVRGSWTLP